MKNDFKKDGKLVVVYETAEERSKIIRILEQQCGFQFTEDQKRPREPGMLEYRTVTMSLK